MLAAISRLVFFISPRNIQEDPRRVSWPIKINCSAASLVTTRTAGHLVGVEHHDQGTLVKALVVAEDLDKCLTGGREVLGYQFFRSG